MLKPYATTRAGGAGFCLSGRDFSDPSVNQSVTHALSKGTQFGRRPGSALQMLKNCHPFSFNQEIIE